MALEKEIQWFDELRASLQTEGRLAWDAIRKELVDGQKPTTNTARDEILLCAAHYPCQYQDNIKCTVTHHCSEQRKTSPIA